MIPEPLRLPEGVVGSQFEFPPRLGLCSAVVGGEAQSKEDLAAAKRHALLLDFDKVRLSPLIDRLSLAALRWRLPTITIWRSSPGCFHAIALCGRPLAEIIKIGAFAGSDGKHRAAAAHYGFSVLRLGPKLTPRGRVAVRAPRYETSLMTPYPQEIMPDWLYRVEYAAVRA